MCIAASAQEEVTTTWPYLYPDFQDGTIYMKGGEKHIQKLNVHVAHADLHFLDKELVRKAVLNDALVIEIGSDRYSVIDNTVAKILASNDKGFIAARYTGDFAALSESGGAYGSSSSTSATMKLSSVDMGNTIGQNAMILIQSKHDGRVLDINVKYFLVTPQFTCPATKKELDQAFSDRADEWKAFLKTHKIKWNNPESLISVLEFIK